MKKAIVTGASGFIGRALTAELLRRGWHVWAIVRRADRLKELGSIAGASALHTVEASLSDYASLPERIGEQNADAFFHLAWDGTFGDAFRDCRRQLSNAAHAAEALQAAEALKVRRFVLAGTIVELEARHYLNTAEEGSEEKPRISCVYGTSKLAAGLLCRTLAARQGVHWNTAVLASVYGEGDRSRMIQNVLITALLKGKSPKLIEGSSLCDWIYIDDAVAGLLAIAEKGRPNRSYYVGHRRLQTFESLVTRTRDIVAPRVRLCFGTLKDATVMDWGQVDRDALWRDTGFACRADFDESICRTVAWLKTFNIQHAEINTDFSGGGYNCKSSSVPGHFWHLPELFRGCFRHLGRGYLRGRDCACA